MLVWAILSVLWALALCCQVRLAQPIARVSTGRQGVLVAFAALISFSGYWWSSADPGGMMSQFLQANAQFTFVLAFCILWGDRALYRQGLREPVPFSVRPYVRAADWLMGGACFVLVVALLTMFFPVPVGSGRLGWNVALAMFLTAVDLERYRDNVALTANGLAVSGYLVRWGDLVAVEQTGPERLRIGFRDQEGERRLELLVTIGPDWMEELQRRWAGK